MPDDLYDRDFLAWSEHQAALLRRLAAGERVDQAVDWSNVIDEVESLGRSELRACESRRGNSDRQIVGFGPSRWSARESGSHSANFRLCRLRTESLSSI